jgi:3' exoribonuclease, RNase T-like
MLLFLDTEYTGPQTSLKLISLALVAEDGSREFYAELADTWTLEDCTPFVTREVLPLLTGPRIPFAEVRTKLLAWLADAPRSVRVACDSVIDWTILIDALGLDILPRVWPENLAKTFYDLRPLIDTSIYHGTVQDYYRTDPREHHALADARAYRRGWLAWMDARKTTLPPDLKAWESAAPVGREFGATQPHNGEEK